MCLPSFHTSHTRLSQFASIIRASALQISYPSLRYVGSLQIIVDKAKGGIYIKNNGRPQISGRPLLLGGSASTSPVSQSPGMMAAIAPFAKGVDDYTQETIGE